ncbi:MAG: GNAT family N-acetyltransferase [Acutalibacteraceae bacterium]
MIDIRHLRPSEWEKALPLVWEVFTAYEAAQYSEKGKTAFWKAIHSKEYLDKLDAYGAFEGNKLVGVIATRNQGAHIALFFVRGECHRQGIGKRLFQTVLSQTAASAVTVHSSLYAVEIYEKLGFVRSGDEREEDGIRYVPMKLCVVPPPIDA